MWLILAETAAFIRSVLPSPSSFLVLNGQPIIEVIGLKRRPFTVYLGTIPVFTHVLISGEQCDYCVVEFM